jgi:hypothetical protein
MAEIFISLLCCASIGKLGHESCSFTDKSDASTGSASVCKMDVSGCESHSELDASTSGGASVDKLHGFLET